MDDSIKALARAQILAALSAGRGLTFNELFSCIDVTDDRTGVMGVLRLLQQERVVQKNDHRYSLTGVKPIHVNTVPIKTESTGGTEPPAQEPILKPAVTINSPPPQKPPEKRMKKQSKKEQVYQALTRRMGTEEIAKLTGLSRKQAADNLCYLVAAKRVHRIRGDEGVLFERAEGGAPSPARRGRRKKTNGKAEKYSSARRAMLKVATVLEILERAAEQAQANMDEYLISCADPAVLKPLQQLRDLAKLQLDNYRVR